VTFDPTPAAGAQPLEPTTGALVYLRDIVEALSQRWNRYVVNLRSAHAGAHDRNGVAQIRRVSETAPASAPDGPRS